MRTHSFLYRSGSIHNVDEQWFAYHRYMFVVCAGHLAPSEHLMESALRYATPEELSGLARHICEHAERYSLLPNEDDDLKSLLETVSSCEDDDPGEDRKYSWDLLRATMLRLARQHEAIHPVTISYIAHSAGVQISAPPTPPILNDIGKLFGLKAEHLRILSALFSLEDVDTFAALIRVVTYRAQLRLLADICEIDLPTFVQETSFGSPLEQLGIIALNGGRDELLDISLSRPLLFALRSNVLEEVRVGLFGETGAPRFQLGEFAVPVEETQTCAAALRGGYPLLISGDPGVGKTEFARTLVNSLGLTAHTLATATYRMRQNLHSRSDSSEAHRINTIRMAVAVLTPGKDVLIIDEADALLQSAAGLFSLFSRGTYDKALLNDLLDNLPIATIWITNAHQMIPASAMRRFGHVYAFPHPAIEMRTRMLTEQLMPLCSAGGQTPGAGTEHIWARELAARYEITPAAIERAARIISAEHGTDTASADEAQQRITAYFDRAARGVLGTDIRRLPTVSPTFELSLCTTSSPLERVERLTRHRAQHGAGLRLLFDGPPGGGKTQYALWLARELGRDVILQRPSDILSKYVGEAEQNIAAAFYRATQTQAVLILDEADALLYDRANARHTWEHSQIAEFLQQVQEFSGILIACTNRVDAVDPALRRRFHTHVTFGPIGREILPRALEHIFPNTFFGSHQYKALEAGPPLMMSDLATAAEMISIDQDTIDSENSATPFEASDVVEEILASARSRDRTQEIGF